MNLLGVIVLVAVILLLIGLVIWASDEYAKVKAGEKWPPDWHERVK